MRAELASLCHCAEPFLGRAAVNLCWYYYSRNIIVIEQKSKTDWNTVELENSINKQSGRSDSIRFHHFILH